jgi:quinol---cytochrome-c reductase cytochrome c subunit
MKPSWAAVIALAAAVLLLEWSPPTMLGQSPSPVPATTAGATPLTTGLASALTEGADIFAAQCSRCHGASGEGAEEGPSLHAIPAGDDSIAGVAEIVQSGPDGMPAFADQLTPSEIDAVAAYVVSQFGTPGQLGPGGELYRVNCAGCHGVTARGGALIYSDVNALSLADVSPAEVVAVVRDGLGTMPAFNETSLSDQSLASIADYVALLEQPPSPGGLALTPTGPVTEGAVALIGLVVILLGAAWVTKGGRG